MLLQAVILIRKLSSNMWQNSGEYPEESPELLEFEVVVQRLTGLGLHHHQHHSQKALSFGYINISTYVCAA
jgi:hypothetical protein